MISLWEVLALGLALGIRHAFDADHLVAVSTIVSEYRNPLRAIWVGVSWGLGHTTTLLLAGAALLVLNLRIPDNITPYFEFAVGVMLVLLGIQTFWTLRRRRVHLHPHSHSNDESDLHLHFHSHGTSANHVHHNYRRWESIGKLIIASIMPGEHSEGVKKAVKPFFRVKSYVVGTVHGLAGSAALMLLVLASLKSTLDGVIYILIFGLGSVVSMDTISILISLPFSISSRMPRLNRMVQAGAGIFSIGFGLVLMYRLG